ncbi:MAG: hypothetical protein JWL77_1600 [Chthonomonadaceae bacterium]|nr:hypothetical protein [Chthonomonadaceae bacterium]
MSLRALWKGWLGEAAGALAHRLLLDNRVYHCLNDVTLSSTDITRCCIPPEMEEIHQLRCAIAFAFSSAVFATVSASCFQYSLLNSSTESEPS